MLSVSAAKPTTSFGRFALRAATVARMSGFSTRLSFGLPLPFLIFCFVSSVRQSATAAANIATSAGSACSTAASISRAVVTFTVFTPAGSGRLTGPDTRITSAPAVAAARAMAWPCFPDERFAR